MGVTTYYSAGGELLGHRTDVGTAYGTDALGSVTVTAIDDQQRTPTSYYYKPYGSLLNKLGNNADPKFQWVGSAGYRKTAMYALGTRLHCKGKNCTENFIEAIACSLGSPMGK